jgi:hypothetical protein
MQNYIDNNPDIVELMYDQSGLTEQITEILGGVYR